MGTMVATEEASAAAGRRIGELLDHKQASEAIRFSCPSVVAHGAREVLVAVRLSCRLCNRPEQRLHVAREVTSAGRLRAGHTDTERQR